MLVLSAQGGGHAFNADGRVHPTGPGLPSGPDITAGWIARAPLTLRATGHACTSSSHFIFVYGHTHAYGGARSTRVAMRIIPIPSGIMMMLARMKMM